MFGMREAAVIDRRCVLTRAVFAVLLGTLLFDALAPPVHRKAPQKLNAVKHSDHLREFALSALPTRPEIGAVASSS